MGKERFVIKGKLTQDRPTRNIGGDDYVFVLDRGLVCVERKNKKGKPYLYPALCPSRASADALGNLVAFRDFEVVLADPELIKIGAFVPDMTGGKRKSDTPKSDRKAAEAVAEASADKSDEDDGELSPIRKAKTYADGRQPYEFFVAGLRITVTPTDDPEQNKDAEECAQDLHEFIEESDEEGK